jgi:methylthioribulose-1-phosphate dehydratase
MSFDVRPHAFIVFCKISYFFCTACDTKMSTRGLVKYANDDPRRVICELCSVFYEKGWVSGTGGGMSVRQGDHVYVAPSGVQKERIDPEDIFVMDMQGNCVQRPSADGLKISACTPLFMAAFTLCNAGAVAHSHSPNTVLATLLWESEFRCTNLEMIKGISGHGYYDTLVVPIIENTAQEEDLRDSLEAAIRAYPRTVAVLVRRHGLYVWGRDWIQAKVHAECLDYLFEVAVRMKQMGIDPELPESRQNKFPDPKRPGGCN